MPSACAKNNFLLLLELEEQNGHMEKFSVPLIQADSKPNIINSAYRCIEVATEKYSNPLP